MEEKKDLCPVEMTAEERAEFEAFKAHKKAKEEQERYKKEEEAYKELVDDTLEKFIIKAIKVSEDLAEFKAWGYDIFGTAFDLKGEMLMRKKGEEMSQYSHTYTHRNKKIKVILGHNVRDNYSDLAEDGIAIVKEYLSSLASDEKSQMLVRAVLDLLDTSKNGTLNAQRVLQLSQLADESNDEQFKKGVKLIRDSYDPILSKKFIRAYIKDEKTNAWKSVPLSVTDALDIEDINNQKEEDNGEV